VRALIVNRMHPRFSTSSVGVLRERARSLQDTDLGRQYANLADFVQVAGDEGVHLRGLAAKVAPAPVVQVPFLESDVHDVEGLDRVARHLF
jgi:hypothetical protein